MFSNTARGVVAAYCLMGAASLSGCIGYEEPPVSVNAPIVGGELGGHPAVVVLQNFRNGGICTGTLIAERVVLTAKHCVQDAFEESPVNPASIVVGVGDTLRGLTTSLRVQTIFAPPGVYTTGPQGSIGSGLVGEDVAVMVLQSGASGVEPIPIRRAEPSDLAGQTITAVGYGQTPAGQVGVKYTTTGRVTRVDGNLIMVGAITCQGDSGGPAITEDDQVAGVVSFGTGSCGNGFGAYNAIHNYLELIDAALTEAGSCLNDGEERCDGADNDCDGEVDETCTAIGGACGADDECVGQTCRETEGGRLCTSPCDPLRPAFGCEAGFYCARTDGCEGFCVPLAGEAALGNGEPCARDDECASLFCADPGDGRSRCLAPCRGDSGMCLAGEACAAFPGECGACVPDGSLVSSRGLGEGCELDEECRSSICYADGERHYCTRECEADVECGAGYHCRIADGEGRCAAGPRGEIGDPCAGNYDCGSGTGCASRGAQSWCTRPCATQECPEGFACIDNGDVQLCAPERGLLGEVCAADDECVTGLCARPNGQSEGICSRACGPDAPCGVGFECRRQDDGVDALCVVPGVATGGGCAVGGARHSGAGWLLVVVVGLGVTRRRRSA